MVADKTIQIGSSGAVLEGVSSDGSRIVYKDKPEVGAGLRECVLVEHEGTRECETVDLSPAVTGESAQVLGVAAVTEDASYVYFVANGVLANSGVPVAGAQRGTCFQSKGTCNLYVSHAGTIGLVARVSGEDNIDWYEGSTQNPGTRTARVSSDDGWFAFMSDRSLTGYDNRDSSSGEPDEEVFLYSASGTGGEGRLVCASCNPTGARPHGEFNQGTTENFLSVTGNSSWAKRWVAANVPGWTEYASDQALYQSRYLSDNGRLFFNSSDALVPQDSDGTEDVYEYEPAGVGNCGAASVTFNPGSDGCVGLISSGTSKEESAFLDASEDGNNVFFLTTASLVRGDIDGGLDVYDARVDGGFPEPLSVPVCEGDACQSPVSAPEDPTPGSLTYSGPGNPNPLLSTVAGKTKSKPRLTPAQKLARALAACRRKKSAHARKACIRRAQRSYGHAAKTGGTIGKAGGR
jgi:hypothetical protein